MTNSVGNGRAALLPWIGGKWTTAPWIIENLPQHKTYVEPFGGGAAVLLRKDPAQIEVYNDLDGELVNFFRVCREHPEQLAARFWLTPYAESEFKAANASKVIEGLTDIERARRFAILCRLSFSGIPGRSFAYAVTAKAAGLAQKCSVWLNMPDSVLLAAARLKHVQILNRDAFGVIETFDSPDTCFYIDPPYHPDTRTEDLYRVEFSAEQHDRLLTVLPRLHSGVVLSGYEHPTYAKALKGWKRVTRDVRATSRCKKSKTDPMRVEVLWIKPPSRRSCRAVKS